MSVRRQRTYDIFFLIAIVLMASYRFNLFSKTSGHSALASQRPEPISADFLKAHQQASLALDMLDDRTAVMNLTPLQALDQLHIRWIVTMPARVVSTTGSADKVAESKTILTVDEGYGFDGSFSTSIAAGGSFERTFLPPTEALGKGRLIVQFTGIMNGRPYGGAAAVEIRDPAITDKSTGSTNLSTGESQKDSTEEVLIFQ